MDTMVSDPDVLVVEDSDEDYHAIRRFLQGDKKSFRVTRCARVEEALTLLDDVWVRAPRNLALVVLDLNMPGLSGRVVLNAIRNHPALRTVPVVILSGSADPQDVRWCYENGANSYHVKSFGNGGMRTTLETLRDYWLERVKLPKDLDWRPVT